MSKKSSFRVADVILIFNILIFGTAAFFLGVEPASYSIITYFAASKTIDFLLHGLEEYTGVTIISDKSEDIRDAIVNTLERGITVYSGEKGFGKHGESSKGGKNSFYSSDPSGNRKIAIPCYQHRPRSLHHTTQHQ